MDLGNWIHIYNLPLHNYGWSMVVKLLKPIEDLVTMKRNSKNLIVALSTLMLLRPSAVKLVMPRSRE